MGFQVSGGWLLIALVWGGLVVALSLRWRHRGATPSLAYSDVTSLLTERRNLRMRLAKLPGLLSALALGLMLLALADPRVLLPLPAVESTRIDDPDEQLLDLPARGAAIYLVLDRSGSMLQDVIAGSRRITRLDSLKRLTRRFVQGRPSDMIGLVTFARTAQVVAPLTLDHHAIEQELDRLLPARSPSEDGTAIGYALFKTVNLIAAAKHFARTEAGERPQAYSIASTAIVLVTDGFQNPHPQDVAHELRTMSLEAAAQTAQREGIKVYLINIEPLIAQPHYRGVREKMERAARCTGGRFYLASSEDQLDSIYGEIDALERVELPQKRRVQAQIYRQIRAGLDWVPVPLSPYLVAAALILLLAAIGLDSTWLRRVP